MDSDNLTTSVIISKLLVDEISTNPAYQDVVDIADILEVDIDTVFDFIRLYKQIQGQMII